jgi:hypothetical protein
VGGPKLPGEVERQTDLTIARMYFQITNVHSDTGYQGRKFRSRTRAEQRSVRRTFCGTSWLTVLESARF